MKVAKLSVSVFCVLAMVLCFSVTSSVAQTKTVKITFSHFWPLGHPVTNLLDAWAKEVEKRTKGTVNVTIFTAGTLTPAPKCYDGVVKGISGMGSSAMGYTKGRFPLMEVLELPWGCETALVATRMANAFYRKFLPQELSDTKVMFFQAHGPGIVHTKKPVRKLEDMKGLKIRSTGTSAKIATALGATPVAMPMGDTYDAIAKGVVDGSMAPISSLAGFKWGEVAKCTTENFGAAYTQAFFVVMNKGAWNSLPADAKAVIEKINEEWIERTGRVWDEYDEMGRDFVKKLGNEIISLSKEENKRWSQACEGMMDEYLKYAQERGLPGNQAVQFCRDYLKNR
ncbi:MAG: TRAP transporter substrate-binding protein [Deltaproteobacteria bacterium]|nr:TRAP transporter substrate-binding protein [Deltaproteobacteria bacterium]